MPVIGRLDGQVDEVLIAPLEKRRRRDEDEPPRKDDERTRGDAAAVDRGERAEPAARDEFEHDATRDELPLWLL